MWVIKKKDPKQVFHKILQIKTTTTTDDGGDGKKITNKKYLYYTGREENCNQIYLHELKKISKAIVSVSTKRQKI